LNYGKPTGAPTFGPVKYDKLDHGVKNWYVKSMSVRYYSHLPIPSDGWIISCYL